MNNTGKIMLIVLSSLFLAVSFYAFIDWFTFLYKDSQTLVHGRGMVLSTSEETGLFLLTLFMGSFAFGVISFIAYRHRRRLEDL